MADLICNDCNQMTGGKCWRHSPYPVTQGLVTKVRTEGGTYQPSWVMPTCHLCGALLVDAKKHDDFHDAVDALFRREIELRREQHFAEEYALEQSEDE